VDDWTRRLARASCNTNEVCREKFSKWRRELTAARLTSELPIDRRLQELGELANSDRMHAAGDGYSVGLKHAGLALPVVSAGSTLPQTLSRRARPKPNGVPLIARYFAGAAKGDLASIDFMTLRMMAGWMCPARCDTPSFSAFAGRSVGTARVF
jgi:hypothetical protein